MSTDEQRYRKLQQQLATLGMAIPGTIREVYLRCGKENCRCMTGDREERHGPYLLWDHKVNGKITSQSIAREDLRTFEGWIANRRAMEELVAKMLALGAQVAAELKR